jgi:stage II sporulation protein D
MLESADGTIIIGDQKWPSPVFIKQSSDRVEAVALVELEEYILGVLEGEMPTSWPVEALKAQAIAARSYVLAQMQDRTGQNFDVDSTTVDQVYKLPTVHPDLTKLKEAVNSTRGMILSKNGKVLKAYYHSSCGGHTERSSNVWGGSDTVRLESVEDPYCQKSPYQDWELTVSQEELKNHFSNLFQSAQIQMRIMTKTSSGRVSLVSVTSLSTAEVITAQELRQKIGYSRLKSTFFTVQNLKDSIVFHGHGFGHGSGLCQWGARSQAMLGRDYRRILKYYYPQAVLVNQDVKSL